MKTIAFALATIAILQIHAAAGTKAGASDTTLGRPVKVVTTPGQFVRFDKNHADRFFFLDQSVNMTLNMVLGAPEMDCFLANHPKDDLRLTYTVYDRTTADGHERVNYATRIVSLKTGDDTKDWAEKELRDSALVRTHHHELQKLRDGKLF
jgi:hypothetical protein